MLASIENQHPDQPVITDLIENQGELALELWNEHQVFEDSSTLTREVAELLGEMSDLSAWSQDRRDAATTLLGELASHSDIIPPLEAAQQVTVAEAYISTVNSLKGEDDWLAAPWSLLEAGVATAAIIGKERNLVQGMRLRGRLAQAWNDYAANVSFPERENTVVTERDLFGEAFYDKLRSLQDGFLQRPVSLESESYERAGPELKRASSALATLYGEALSRKSSAKLDVFRACPEYRERLTKRGVDLAAFWNLNEPTAIVEKLEAVLLDDTVNKAFNAEFDKAFGCAYDDISDTEKRALADDSLEIARKVYVTLYERQTSFGDIRQRIGQQLSEAREMANPSRKLKPILKWIRQVEPEFAATQVDEMESFIADHEDRFRTYYQERQAPLLAAIGGLESIMAESAPDRLKFMRRDAFDVRSGNLTADCTAWNMEVGFNAWTVPAWVTNPAFNFVYVMNHERMVAKFGMLLAFDQANAPAVIVDSIETNKNLAEHEKVEALGAIYEGFAELQAWADRNGFGRLRICTFTNSTELTAELPISSAMSDAEAARAFYFDGLRASQELTATVDPEVTIDDDDIYLQSKSIDEIDDEEVVGIVEGLQVFETLAQRALAVGRRSEEPTAMSEQQMLDAFRSADRDQIIKALVHGNVPEFAQKFDFDYQALEELYDYCVDQGRTFHEAEHAVCGQALFALESGEDAPFGFELLPDGLRLKDSAPLMVIKRRRREQVAEKMAKEGLLGADYDLDDIDIDDYDYREYGDKETAQELLDLLEKIFLRQIDIQAAAKSVFGLQRPRDIWQGEEGVLGLKNLPIYQPLLDKK